MKSEPSTFSLDDLRNRPGQREAWDGVRNYQARNFMRDEMSAGDRVLFYHSNCAEPGVVGLAEVASSEAYPDPTQFDPDSDYYDPRSSPEAPRWWLVELRYLETFARNVSLREIKEDPQLEGILVARRGMRLSIQAVEGRHYERICNLGRELQ